MPALNFCITIADYNYYAYTLYDNMLAEMMLPVAVIAGAGAGAGALVVVALLVILVCIICK